MDDDIKQTNIGLTLPMIMEGDDSDSSGVVGDEDEEFLSCEEEDMPRILLTSEEAHPGIQQTEEVAEGVSDDDQRESRNNMKSSDTDGIQDICQPIDVFLASNNTVESHVVRGAFHHTAESKSLSNDTSLSETEETGEGKHSETVLEVEHQVAEGFVCENKDNKEDISLKLEVGNALLLPWDKASDNSTNETICGIDDNEDEESEDDCEFHDTRSSFSRIQSLDDEFTNILETACETPDNFVSSDEDTFDKDVTRPILIFKNPEDWEVMDSEKPDIKASCRPLECSSVYSRVQQECSLCSFVASSGFEQRKLQEDFSVKSWTPMHSLLSEFSDVNLIDSKSSIEVLESDQDMRLMYAVQAFDCSSSLGSSNIIEQTEKMETTSTLSGLDSLTDSHSYSSLEGIDRQAGSSELLPTVDAADKQISEVNSTVNVDDNFSMACPIVEVAWVSHSTVNKTEQVSKVEHSRVDDNVQQVSKVDHSTVTETGQQVSEVNHSTLAETGQQVSKVDQLTVTETGQQVSEVDHSTLAETGQQVSKVHQLTVTETVHTISEIDQSTVHNTVHQVSVVDQPTVHDTVQQVSVVDQPTVHDTVQQVSVVGQSTVHDTVQQVSVVDQSTQHTNKHISEADYSTLNTTAQQVSEVDKTVNLNKQLCPIFYKLSEEGPINVVQDYQPASEVSLMAPTHKGVATKNLTASAADKHVSSLGTPQPSVDRTLIQLSTSLQSLTQGQQSQSLTQEQSSHSLTPGQSSLRLTQGQSSLGQTQAQPSHSMIQDQQPCVMSPISEIDICTDIKYSVNTNDEHKHINTSKECFIETRNDDEANNEVDRVSDDSLEESVSVSTCCDDVACVGDSDTDPSDSLDEEDKENDGDSYKDDLTKLEAKPRQIDKHQAKLRSSLSWLLCKVYGSNVPKELQDPFYETSEGQLVLRPVMVNLMSSSELYCQACSNMFPETYTQWKGHWNIIQVLSRKGIYISEIQESAVTETVLVQTAPFRLKAHLALIDALMKAYTCEVAGVEKVVKAVRQITTFPASSELPGTPEEALIFWINKVCAVLGTEGFSKGRTEDLVEGIAGPKVRAASRTSSRHEPVQVSFLEDLMRDIGDGCSVAAVIAYYRPHLLNIKDLYLQEGVGIANSLHNLSHIGQFCRNHLPWKCFYLSYEDLLYTQDIMKVNIIAFLADLFNYFEGPDSCEGESHGPVGSARPSNEKVDAIAAAGKKSSQTVHPSIPISQATKRSFHRQGLEETANNLGMGRSTSSIPTMHQPLLSKRITGRHCIPQEEGGVSATSSTNSIKRRTGRRTMSLFTPQDREIVHKSVLAWQDDQGIPHRSDEYGDDSSGYDRLLGNVSADSALNQNFNANNNLSLDLSGLDAPFLSSRCGLDISRPEYIDLDSGTSRLSNIITSPQQHLGRRTPTNTDQMLEPLMPALLKPSKERETNLSKAEERGDRSPRRKKIASPSELQSPSASRTQRSTAQLLHHMENNVNMGVQSEKSPVSSLHPDAAFGRSQSPYYTHQLHSPRGRVFEAFVVGPDSKGPLDAKEAKLGNFERASQENLDRATDISTTGSYTVRDRASSAHAARAAGIPVVSDSEDMTLNTVRSREGSIASSGEYSDHESQKIHQEYKVRESGLTTTPESKVTNINNNSKPGRLISDHLSNINSKSSGDGGTILSKLSLNTTNFAELKQLKDKLGYNLDKVDRNALIYMQSGSHGGPYDKMSGLDFKSIFAIKQDQGQQESKDESANTGTRGQHAEVSGPAVIPDNASLEGKDTNPGSLELQQLRLKLEQKRKDIERKKHRQEAQQNKMRQQLGKAAFMRVVTKHVDGEAEGEPSDQTDTARSEHTSNSAPHAKLATFHSQPSQKLQLGGSSRSQLPAHPHALKAASGQGSVIPADASAQRFTDWRTQGQFPRGGSGTNISALASVKPSESKNLDNSQQFVLMRSGAVGGSDAGSDHSSVSSGNKAFSREGIQQTIDTVRNKWFRSDNDLISGEGAGSDDEDIDGGSFRLHEDDLLAGARVKAIREHSISPARSHSQSPLPGVPQAVPTHGDASIPIPAQQTASNSQPVSDLEYQVYDSSLNKLNNSLTELQGEIMRLSLQHEQLKAAQSPVSGQAGGFTQRLNDSPAAVGSTGVGVYSTQSRPIHGIPQQGLYMHGTRQGAPFSSGNPQPPPSTTYLPQQNDYDFDIPAHIDSLEPALSNISFQNRSINDGNTTPDQFRQNISESDDAMNINNDGFFVSFGDHTTPKRLKPKLEHRSRGVSPAPTASQATTPSTVAVVNIEASLSNDVAANLASQAIVPALNTQKDHEHADESSPNIGFIMKDKTAAVGEPDFKDKAVAVEESTNDDDMQKKRIKLIEMQRKRKEEQERKRSEKEAETARKQEEKQLKDEEHERKKAEEKARREIIFQQYIQKKQEDDDSPVKPPPRKRDASASKTRPKSMFVKSKAMTPEPGTLAPDSGSSSQEDLTSKTNVSGRSTPAVMSALRSTFHFRLPEPSRIRKAVSCNTLQGATNGAQGPSTYRRPPSPDLNRLKQQRQRGNNHDSGSETSAVSNPAYDYAGPKLFVKPSAKSNRHIIVNAISHCCLAGSVNTDLKNRVLEEMSKCEANHFLILFRDAGCQYRGLFILYPETEEAFKVHGVGPKHIANTMCERFYKYNSGGKSFSEITSTKHLSVSVDAVVLHTAVWKSVKAVIKR